MQYVTIKREAVKNALRPLVQAAIARRVAAAPWQHANRDSYYSPSQWWADAAHTQRHSLRTDISATAAGNTISIRLAFEVVEI